MAIVTRCCVSRNRTCVADHKKGETGRKCELHSHDCWESKERGSEPSPVQQDHDEHDWECQEKMDRVAGDRDQGQDDGREPGRLTRSGFQVMANAAVGDGAAEPCPGEHADKYEGSIVRDIEIDDGAEQEREDHDLAQRISAATMQCRESSACSGS